MYKARFDKHAHDVKNIPAWLQNFAIFETRAYCTSVKTKIDLTTHHQISSKQVMQGPWLPDHQQHSTTAQQRSLATHSTTARQRSLATHSTTARQRSLATLQWTIFAEPRTKSWKRVLWTIKKRHHAANFHSELLLFHMTCNDAALTGSMALDT